MNRSDMDRISHEKCKDCDYAVYCYTKPSLWVFRTQEEMEKKIAYIESCLIRKGMETELKASGKSDDHKHHEKVSV